MGEDIELATCLRSYGPLLLPLSGTVQRLAGDGREALTISRDGNSSLHIHRCQASLRSPQSYGDTMRQQPHAYGMLCKKWWPKLIEMGISSNDTC